LEKKGKIAFSKFGQNSTTGGEVSVLGKGKADLHSRERRGGACGGGGERIARWVGGGGD